MRKCYCPSTKLEEGNVFTGVCLSMGVGISGPMSFQGVGISGPMSFLREFLVPGPFQGMDMSRGWVLIPEICPGCGYPSPPIHGTWDTTGYGRHASFWNAFCFSHFHSL